jgi:hypothetical protein
MRDISVHDDAPATAARCTRAAAFRNGAAVSADLAVDLGDWGDFHSLVVFIDTYDISKPEKIRPDGGGFQRPADWDSAF